MSFGRLGVAAPAASTLTTIYTVPASVLGAEVDIDIVNTTGANITFSMAFSLTGTPVVNEYIEQGTVITANGRYMFNDNKLSPGENVVITATAVGLVVRVSGKELVL